MSNKLPVFHIYTPLTLGKSLASLFQAPQYHESKCIYLLGQYEKAPRKTLSNTLGTSSNVTNKVGVLTRSKRESLSNTKAASLNDVDVDTDGDAQIISVTILGMAPVQSKPILNFNKELQLIGMAFAPKAGLDFVKSYADTTKAYYNHPLLFQFQFHPTATGLIIPAVTWNGVHYDLHSTTHRVFVFDYDPNEFQRWKFPKSYPNGLPPVFQRGLNFIQKSPLPSDNRVTPAFTPVPKNFQDLNTCFHMPQSSILNTNFALKFLCERSSGLNQVAHKVSIATGAVLGSYPVLPVLNFLFLLALDSLLGYVITRYLLQFPNLLGVLHTNVEMMLDKLNHLLNWLRGAPAGLKLNPNLNSLYWRFFSYHIHLWASYIGILEPVFAIIINTIQYFGVLGATIQMALMKDLLSLATFHVYCLYIYATRLYGLQITALKALSRIFFGRKYNPLRQRVDSVQLTTPELFLSSFGFVILIFLLPTTLVYYTGFVFLRVPALLGERLLQYIVRTYNRLPFLSWLLVLIRSPRVADEIYMEPLDHHENASITRFRIRLQSTRVLFTPPNFATEIKHLVGSVMGGSVLKD